MASSSVSGKIWTRNFISNAESSVHKLGHAREHEGDASTGERLREYMRETETPSYPTRPVPGRAVIDNSPGSV